MMKKHSTRRHPWAQKVDEEFAKEQLAIIVRDKKTGRDYNPEAAFLELLKEPWFKAQMKRMASK
jgi:hypothetical protein